jgi:hypothetical protein
MNFRDLYLKRVILELRYDDGFLYWDKCGETLSEFKNKFPEWTWEMTSTELTKFKNIKRNMEFTFNINNIRFSQDDVENLNQFKEASEKITPIIVNKLEIKKFTRVGNRYWYILPLTDIEQGKAIINKSAFVQIPEEKLTLFGPNAKKTAFFSVIEKDNLHYRVEFAVFERNPVPESIKINEFFNPKYGLRFDVDIAIVSKVDSLTFDCGDFEQKNKVFLENNLIKFIEE